MNKPTLLVLAAGMGSRYGGLKQIDPMGPNGETILDYSLYDARLAGFERVVFVIKRVIYDDFRRVVGDRVARQMQVEYVFQEIDSLPAGLTPPAGREKPWGTGHAILCARDKLRGPFGAVNADDFYGRSCFEALYRFLAGSCSAQEMGLVGFTLENTLTEHGGVSRGVCSVENSLLRGVEEHVDIRREGALIRGECGERRILSPDTVVSMNVWGFHPAMFTELERQFIRFFDRMDKPLTQEYYIPHFADHLIKSGLARFKVLTSDSKWFGVTYPEDRAAVKAALAQMAAERLYPQLA